MLNKNRGKWLIKTMVGDWGGNKPAKHGSGIFNYQIVGLIIISFGKILPKHCIDYNMQKEATNLSFLKTFAEVTKS